MDGLPVNRRRILWRAVAAMAVVGGLGAAASCSAGAGGGTAGTGSPATATATAAGSGPVTAEISQFRDNYSKRIIEIQLTNTTGGALSVLGAELASPLFAAPITWPARPGGIELPPGQTKSLAAPLPAPDCGGAGAGHSASATEPGGDKASAVVSLQLGAPGGAVPATSPPAATSPAADPFGVLARNNAEMCLAREASAVATIGLAPELEIAPDRRTAVVRLLITPSAAARTTDSSGTADAGGGSGGGLVIDLVQETPLLAEAPDVPWPRAVTIRAGGPPMQLRLGVRPARCDPHAVAEDKVGTLLPLRVRVAGREGVLKIDAGSQLRDRIYDFVTKSCGRQ